MPTWAKFVLALILPYAAVVFALFLFQRALIYPAPQSPVPLPEGFEEHVVETADGLRLKLAYRAGKEGYPTLVFFHGNGDSLVGASIATAVMAEAGYGVVLPEYRGYAGNPGSPSEEGFYEDGRAAIRWLQDRGIDADSTVLVGNSIGSGVATQMASESDVAALILISPFTSLTRLASEKMPWAPVRLLLRDEYDNASKLIEIDVPILVLHGDRDGLIPAEHGERLAVVSENATFRRFDDAGHDLAYLPEAGEAQRDWLEEQLPPQQPAE